MAYNWEWVAPLILYSFLLVTSIQIFYYLFFYSRIFKKREKKEKQISLPVSIIVAAHNEEENLKKYLPLILEQDYPVFELIVINDRSEDNTDALLEYFKGKYTNLKTTFIKNTGKLKHGKKVAITLGVKAASYDHLLLTDADCYPNSKNWIAEMVSSFTQEKEIVLAYGPYKTLSGFLNKIIRFDTLFIALQYLTFADAGIPYMGIGRNLAYKKELFEKNRGLASHAQIASGDDDLFINEVANSKNTAIVITPESFTYSNPKLSFKDWVRQKQRHFLTFHRYKTIHKILLFGEPFTRILFYLLIIPNILLNTFSIALYIAILLRIILLVLVFWKATQVLKEKKLFFLIILLDFILPVLNFFIHLRNKPKR